MNGKPIRGSIIRYLVMIALAMAVMASVPVASLAVVYATIGDIKPESLTNAIQITVKGDGTLDWVPEGTGYYGGDFSGRSNRISIRIRNARSTVKNFVDVSMYPVSYVQTSVPQDAVDGVGICLSVGLFTASDFSVRTTPDRQSIIITIQSTRTIDNAGKTGAANTTDQNTGLTCVCDNGKMSIHALKADMLKVFGQIAKASGANIVVDDAVERRTVSMSIDGKTTDEVLQTIASAYGLALLERNGVYMVSEGVPTDLAPYSLSGTQSFPMKYVKAQAASSLLPTFLYSYLHVNNEQNAVVVTAPRQMLDKISKDLAKIDIAPPQIMVEVIAVEVSSQDDVSVKLGLKGQNANSGQASLDTEDGAISYTTVGKLPNEFQANLKALVADHKAEINSCPRMAVVNGQRADIFIGAQRFVRIQYGQESGQKLERIQGVDVGTKIEVTPWTGGNGEITTTISPKVSNVIALDTVTGLPTLSSRTASTTIRVKDGETIVIGGLDQEQFYYTTRRVPVLGNLPLVGHLFRSKRKNITNTQLMILITPRILTETGHMPDAADEERVKQRMLQAPITK